MDIQVFALIFYSSKTIDGCWACGSYFVRSQMSVCAVQILYSSGSTRRRPVVFYLVWRCSFCPSVAPPVLPLLFRCTKWDRERHQLFQETDTRRGCLCPFWRGGRRQSKKRTGNWTCQLPGQRQSTLPRQKGLDGTLAKPKGDFEKTSQTRIDDSKNHPKDSFIFDTPLRQPVATVD